jgi:nicotinate phosphoribosyltransferase
MNELFPALLTDLYQLTMAQAYFDEGLRENAVFELFVRTLPPTRRVLIAAGLEQVVEYLEGLRFDSDDIEHLRALGSFSAPFLTELSRLRFTGSVRAMPEGTACFAGEPLLTVTAPIIEAQLIESRVLNLVHLQTVLASKALRFVLASRGRPLVDFGMRRAHGQEAALYAARAAYLAGFEATATVEAGRRFGIPLSGTMAHSYIEAHADEATAFRHFVESRKQATTLLIDTYDVERAAYDVVKLVQERRERGTSDGVAAVRIDSGDLALEARRVRGILDAGGCRSVKIILSGGLDEEQVERLLDSEVPVDAFGVGTALAVAQEAPALDMAYKLVEYAGMPRRKRSPGKATWPGRKQVFRRTANGAWIGDSIVLENERLAGDELLHEVMRAGRRVSALPALEQIRAHCRMQREQLPEDLRILRPGASGYGVSVSRGVEALAARLDAEMEARSPTRAPPGR